MSIEVLLTLITLVWFTNALFTVWDFVPTVRPSWWVRLNHILPEWGPVMVVCGAVPILLGWLGVLDSAGFLRVPQEMFSVLIVIVLISAVWPMASMIWFARPRFLIPPWRRLEMDKEDRRDREQKAERLLKKSKRTK